MPLYKYRSFQEAEEHLQKLLPADPLERLRSLEVILAALKPRKAIPRGVIKFKTLEEANRHRRILSERSEAVQPGHRDQFSIASKQ